MSGLAGARGGGARRRYLSVPAGSFAAPTPPGRAAALAEPPEERPLAGLPALAPAPASSTLVPPAFLPTDVESVAATPAEHHAMTPAASPAAPVVPSEEQEGWTSTAFSTSEPAPPPEPSEERHRATRPSPGTLGMLAGAAIGAIIGVVLSTAMLALYAPDDFAGAIAQPVALWTNVEDWKVLAGAVLIVVGFAVLGAGQGAQAAAPRD